MGDLSASLSDMLGRGQTGEETGLPNVDTINPNWAERSPEDAQGRLIEEQQDLFRAKFRPLEDQVIARTMDDGLSETVASEGASRVRRVFSKASDRTGRQLSRYGREPSADLASALQRKSGLSEARSAVGAANDARASVQDMQTQWGSGLMNVGQGLSDSSTSSLGTASSMASERERIGEQRAAQNKQSTISTIGTAVGIGAALGL